MRGLRKCCFIGFCLLGFLLAYSERAWGVLNNGFETDYFWTCTKNKKIKIHQESDLTELSDFYSDGNKWWSMTFSGTGDNDARFFAMLPSADYKDAEIAEFNSGGTKTNSRNISAIAGAHWVTLASACDWENIRYNPIRNSLVVGVSTEVAGDTIRAYEFDLSLNYMATYTGPTTTTDTAPCVAVNTVNGKLYIMSKGLNSGDVTKGDVIAFDTSGGSTSVWTTVIDSDTLGDADYYEPESIIFRREVPGNGNQNTILVNFRSGTKNTKEYKLDGTLLKTHTGLRADAGTHTGARFFNGQQDRLTGNVIIASLGSNHYELAADDSIRGDLILDNAGNYYDAASPGALGGAPVIAEVTPDPITADPNVEYIQQLILTQGELPVTWSLMTGPTGAQVDGNGQVYGWTPGTGNIGSTFDFAVKATNVHGEYTEDWQVYVDYIAPIIQEVTPDPMDIPPNVEYAQQLILVQGSTPISWSVIQGPTGAQVDGNGYVYGWTPSTGDIGSYFTFEIQASNVKGSDTETWQVHVIGTPPVIAEVIPSFEEPDSAFAGTEYLKQMTLIQGDLPITWTVVTGPTGMQVSSSGQVNSWTPASAEIGTEPPYTVQIRASNASGSDDESWTVEVIDPDNLNNGFRKDWVYQCRAYVDGGEIRAFRERNGTIAKDEWAPGLSDWTSLTFSGTGDNDARMFVIQPNPKWRGGGVPTDILVAELDSEANILKQAKIGALPGGPGENNLGTELEPQNIRYSSYHNSLFVGVNPTWGVSTPAKAYEVDLNITSVLNVYTGPNVTGGAVDLAINPEDGTLYMVAMSLNGTDGKGDLISFDTSGGSTSSYTTLIDGATLGDPSWFYPWALTYRGKNNPSGRPTILVMHEGDEDLWPVTEFYLDETNPGTGNLVKRGEPISLVRGYGGQLDLVNGTVWFGARGGPANMIGLGRDDMVIAFDTSNRSWLDAGSPPGTPFCSRHIVFADADGDNDVDQDDFAMFQICYTGPGVQTPSEPIYCRCLDREPDNDIDQADFAEFENCATGPGITWSGALTPDCNP